MGLFPDWKDDMGRKYLRSKIGLILGGPPSHLDFRPSLTCIFIYTSLLIPLAVRLYNGSLSFKRLWKLLLVILISIVAFSIRIKLSEGQNWNKDLFITEMILLRFTTILLTSAFINLFQDALIPYRPTKQTPNLLLDILLNHFITGLRAAAFFCLALTIAISFDVKQAINGSLESRIKLHRSKEVTIFLLVAINGSVYFLMAIPAYMLWRGMYNGELVIDRRREVVKFAWLTVICSLLLIVAGFKTAQLASTNTHNRFTVIINHKSLYYGICVLSEYIVCLLFVLLPWHAIIPPEDKLRDRVRLKRSGGMIISSPILNYDDIQAGHHFQLYNRPNQPFHQEGQMTYDEELTQSEDYIVSSAPSNKKRDSTQTLSTISEVRIKRAPKHLVAITTPVKTRTRASSCHIYSEYPLAVEVSASRLSMPPTLDAYLAPPPSANESIRSHWSDDSQKEKRGLASIITLMKNAKAPLSRKNSRSSRSSIGKGDRSADSVER